MLMLGENGAVMVKQVRGGKDTLDEHSGVVAITVTFKHDERPGKVGLLLGSQPSGNSVVVFVGDVIKQRASSCACKFLF